MFKSSVVLSLLVFAAGNPALAKARVATPDQVVAHHLRAFTQHNWDALIQDYAPNAVVITQNGPIEGIPAIYKFYQSINSITPAPDFQVTLVPAVGDAGLADWVMNPHKPGSLKGHDIFIVRNGKIQFQTTVNVRPASQP